jgi:hypothetical protein
MYARYDAITGSEKSVLSDHTSTVVALAFSLDGSLLVSIPSSFGTFTQVETSKPSVTTPPPF